MVIYSYEFSKHGTLIQITGHEYKQSKKCTDAILFLNLMPQWITGKTEGMDKANLLSLKNVIVPTLLVKNDFSPPT
jgi:hypothetical protein